MCVCLQWLCEIYSQHVAVQQYLMLQICLGVRGWAECNTSSYHISKLVLILKLWTMTIVTKCLIICCEYYFSLNIYNFSNKESERESGVSDKWHWPLININAWGVEKPKQTDLGTDLSCRLTRGVHWSFSSHDSLTASVLRDSVPSSWGRHTVGLHLGKQFLPRPQMLCTHSAQHTLSQGLTQAWRMDGLTSPESMWSQQSTCDERRPPDLLEPWRTDVDLASPLNKKPTRNRE